MGVLLDHPRTDGVSLSVIVIIDMSASSSAEACQ
jgi:hypothetical protein